MPFNPSSVQSLRRVFNDGFSAHDIAEPLLSFDAEAAAGEVKAFMTERRLQVVGVRRNGLVVGFVERDALGDGRCGDSMEPLDDSLVILDSIPIAELIVRLKDRQRLFVSLLGSVGGIVSRTDLQKPPVRMWLFGMVSLIEMRFSRMIEHYHPDEAWREFLSEGRVQKAGELLSERVRRNQQVKLLDCLQFSDKGQIMIRSEPLRSMMQFESRTQFQDVIKRVERLRNNLAHSQDIIESDWATIVQLSENLDRVLEGPSGSPPVADE